MRDELELIESSAEVEILARSVQDNGGIYLVPAFTGLGAPHWDMNARATMVGMTRGTNKGHIARAALEAISYQCQEVLKIMQQDSDYEISELKVDGGATGNELLMQMQADISNLRVNRSRVQETTVLGAAFVAGIGAGFWKSKSDISSIRHTKRVYTPSMTDEERTEKLSFWAKAVERSKEWIA